MRSADDSVDALSSSSTDDSEPPRLATFDLTLSQERSIQLAIYLSSSLSLIGISYVILHFCWHHYASYRRWRRWPAIDFSAKLVLVLSVFDLATILARIVGRSVVANPTLCTMQAAVLHATSLGSCLWVCCMAFYLYKWIVGGESDATRQSRFALFVAVAVVPSVGFVVYHVATDRYGDATFYCWLQDDQLILLHFYLFYALMVVYILVLHALIHCNMKRRVAWHDTIEADTSSMLIRRKNLLYIVVFIVHRAPMMVYRILEAIDIHSFEYGLLAQIILDLDGLSNSIVYGGLCRHHPLVSNYDRDDNGYDMDDIETLPRGRTFPADSISSPTSESIATLDDLLKKSQSRTKATETTTTTANGLNSTTSSGDDLELMLALASAMMSASGASATAAAALTGTTPAHSTALANSTRRPVLFPNADDIFMRSSMLHTTASAPTLFDSASAAIVRRLTRSPPPLRRPSSSSSNTTNQQRRPSTTSTASNASSSRPQRAKKLPLFVSTFNMGEQNVHPNELASWIPLGYQIYVIGVQECMDLADLQTKVHHHLVVGSQCKFVYYSREIGKRATALGYHGYIALSVFVREKAVLDGRFEMPQRQRSHRSGAQEVFRGKSLLVFGRASNKGAVGMSFRYDQTSFAFATCHLASDSSSAKRLSKRTKTRDGSSNHRRCANNSNISNASNATSLNNNNAPAAMAPPSKLERRNQDAMQILQQLYLDAEDYGFGFPLLHHHSFVLGDLNYRMTRRNASPHDVLAQLIAVGAARAATIDVVPLPTSPRSVVSSDGPNESPTASSFGFRECVTPKIEHRPTTVAALVDEHDELHALLESNQLFYGFHEPPITFFPTFRRERGQRLDPSSADSFAANYTLVTAKGGYRVPSFTDRVLYASLAGATDRVECIAYSACENVTTSDHKPVCAIFQVTLNDPLPPSVVVAPASVSVTAPATYSPSPVDDSIWTNSGGGSSRGGGGYSNNNRHVTILTSTTAASASRMRDVPGACEMRLTIDFSSIYWMDAIDAPGAALFDRVEDIEFGFLFPLPCEDVFSQQRKLHEVAEFLTWMDSGPGNNTGHNTNNSNVHTNSSSSHHLNGTSGGCGGNSSNVGSGADFAATVTPTSNFHTIKWNNFVEGGLRYTTMAQPSSNKHVAVLVRATSRVRGLSRTASSTATTSGASFGSTAGTTTGAHVNPATSESTATTKSLKTTAGAGQILGQGTFCVDASGRKTDTLIPLTVGGKLLGRLQLNVALQVRRPRAASGHRL